MIVSLPVHLSQPLRMRQGRLGGSAKVSVVQTAKPRKQIAKLPSQFSKGGYAERQSKLYRFEMVVLQIGKTAQVSSMSIVKKSSQRVSLRSLFEKVCTPPSCCGGPR